MRTVWRYVRWTWDWLVGEMHTMDRPAREADGDPGFWGRRP